MTSTRRARVPLAPTAPRLTQREAPVNRPSRYRQGRRQPGRDARDECQRQAEAKDVHVDRELLQSRDRRRPEQHQCAHNPERETCTGRPAEHPENEALGQQLRDQLAPARAESRPHGHLAATRLSACEQQIRDVRAGDQQHERDRAENGHQVGRMSRTIRSCSGMADTVASFSVCGNSVARRSATVCSAIVAWPADTVVLQARQYLHPLCAARAGREITRLEDERLPEFRGGRKPQTGRSDSDNRHRLAIERRRRVHDVRTSRRIDVATGRRR